MSRYRDRERDFAYMGWVKSQPCAAAGMSLGPCGGGIEADHAGTRALSRKADDDTCIALCSLHHRQRTDHSGPFRAWSRAQMRAWLDKQIAIHQERWASRHGDTGIPF